MASNDVFKIETKSGIQIDGCIAKKKENAFNECDSQNLNFLAKE